MEFETFPNEVIYELCSKMDDQGLSRFMRTSDRNYQICKDILNDRKEVFIQRGVDEIIDRVKAAPQGALGFVKVRFQSDQTRIFDIDSYKNRTFFLHEVIIEPVSAAQKLGLTKENLEVSFNIENDSEESLRDVLYQLFENGYLNKNLKFL